MPSAGQRDAIASPGEEHGSGNGRLPFSAAQS
jgi:hypothetical protein